MFFAKKGKALLWISRLGKWATSEGFSHLLSHGVLVYYKEPQKIST